MYAIKSCNDRRARFGGGGGGGVVQSMRTVRLFKGRPDNALGGLGACPQKYLCSVI